MANPFHLELSMREEPAEAQAHAVSALTEPARVVGLRLTKRGAAQLGYRPRVQFPFLLMLWHYLDGVRMTVNFEAGEGGGTRVTISGGATRGRHALAADPDHWAEPLGAERG